MVFVGACLMPHGPSLFDGDPNSPSEACRHRRTRLPADMVLKFEKLYTGMCEAGDKVAAMDPDVIVLHTPHGIKLTSSIGVYITHTARGSAEWKGHWSEFEVEVKLAKDRSESLVQHFRHDGIPTEGISCFNNVTAPLKWGEAAPAWFVTRSLKKDVRYILINQCIEPWPVTCVGEDRLRVGRSLGRFIDGVPERVAVLISGDLSHVYHSEYPDDLYQPAAGWTLQADHISACAMERAFLGWVKSPPEISLFETNDDLPPSGEIWSARDALPWLQKAAELQPTAYSCGLVGIILLHAFLEHENMKGVQVASTVTACEAPTYYGMMAAVFKVIK